MSVLDRVAAAPGVFWGEGHVDGDRDGGLVSGSEGERSSDAGDRDRGTRQRRVNEARRGQ
jgi:hypothetical protein